MRRQFSSGSVALVGGLFVTAMLSVRCSSEEAPITPGPLDGSLPPPDASPLLDAGNDASETPFSCDSDADEEGIFQHLRCTGLYDANGDIAEGVSSYTPAEPFWSDGAHKERFLYLPPGTVIDSDELNAWVFPIGTKAWKDFRFVEDGEDQRIETRLAWKRGERDWVFVTYAWDERTNDGLRLDTGRPNARGSYEIPTKAQCTACHRGAQDGLLAVTAVDLGLPGATGITLQSLAEDGRLSTPPAQLAFALPDDGTAFGARALRYLHSNCSSCHSERAQGNTRFFADIDANLLMTGAPASELSAIRTGLGVASRGGFGVQGFQLLFPGDPTRSEVLARIASRTAGQQMPPLGTHERDLEGEALLETWLSAMPPP